MTDIVEVMVSFPTVVFTVPLIASLIWFLLGMIVSGLDFGEGDLDLDLDADGDVDALEHLAAALHLGVLGAPLVLLMLSFAAWATSLLLSLAVDDFDVSTGLAGAVTLLVALLVGMVFVWRVGGPLGRALVTVQAPERRAAIGCLCKVRTVEVTRTFGDAEIISGPMSSSIVKVRAEPGAFRRGDVALLVELDDEHDAYWIAEIEEQYRPRP